MNSLPVCLTDNRLSIFSFSLVLHLSLTFFTCVFIKQHVFSDYLLQIALDHTTMGDSLCSI